MALVIKNLFVSIEEKPILKDFSLTIEKGEVHVLMGRNGTGKSTLAKVLAGHPDYTVDKGSIELDGVSLLDKEPDEIARLGLFLAFQYPIEISGVSIANFIRTALRARLPKGAKFSAKDFYATLRSKMKELNIDPSFTSRSVNDGFSGGEKKRCEILQMSMLDPSCAVLDETDSGLDVDALKIVAEGINRLRNKERCFLIVTHYQRILNYIVPDKVHVIHEGKIVKSGDAQLAVDLEEKGYDWVNQPITL